MTQTMSSSRLELSETLLSELPKMELLLLLLVELVLLSLLCGEVERESPKNDDWSDGCC